MVRLRNLASEFNSLGDFTKDSVILHMPYLDDFDAFQKYMDGDLSLLFDRMRGNALVQDVTGAAMYETAGIDNILAYYIMNLFRAGLRYRNSAIWEKNPTALDADEEDVKAWEEISIDLLREARKTTEWEFAKGHGVFHTQKIVGGEILTSAVDPAGYLPIVDLINRDLVLGKALFYRWYSAERVPSLDRPDRLTFNIFIDERGAAMSDGRLEVTNKQIQMIWSGMTGSGVATKSNTNTERNEYKFDSMEDSARTLAIHVFGDGDSIFATMERTVYEAILSLSHSRTALNSRYQKHQGSS